MPLTYKLEPNDLDTIYKVLKKAGEMSATTTPVDKPNQAGSSSAMTPTTMLPPPTMDIPIVNVPDYPDRTPRWGPMKSQGPIAQQPKQGLTAPSTADVSSSGPKICSKILDYLLSFSTSSRSFYFVS